MFLHLLSESQQKAFLAVARQFVESDSRLSGPESNLLELMWAETGLLELELPSGDLESLLAEFDTRQARAAVLLELIGVGHADEEFHPEESALLARIAAAFGTPEAELQAMDAWVVRQLALAREVEQFWS